jgi:DNA-binding GntR family transcriptional regulator
MNFTEYAEAIRPRLLYEGIADSLRDALFAHRLQPGAAVDEIALARHYGVSRTPVREAIKVLVRDGLLSTHHGSGCHVARTDRDDLAHILDVMQLLDAHTLHRLAECPHAAVVAVLARWERNAGHPSERRRAVWTSFCADARNTVDNGLFMNASNNLYQRLRLALGPALDRIDGGGTTEQRRRLGDALLDLDHAAIDRLASAHHQVLRAAVLACGTDAPGSDS